MALNTVFELAKSDPKVVFVGSDLGFGTLDKMKNEMPDQFFMEGISEQHLIGFAAGLAKQGFIPFVNTIANFLSRRALEQIILDVALHKLPVKILASGGGMVYAPLGPSHTAPDDLAHMLAIPNLDVFAPCDAHEMRELLHLEHYKKSPAYVRFGKGGEEIVSDKLNSSENENIKYLGKKSAELVIVTTGVLAQAAYKAVNELLIGEDVLLIHITQLNIDLSHFLQGALHNKKKILVVEEHQDRGGLLTQILHFCFRLNLSISNLKHLSLGFGFIRHYGSQSDHLSKFNLTPEMIAKELIG